ncbi:MAG: hypothetical protein ACI915_003970 [Gammaproteobacteria bacterium]|jgi:hypothetical protein
MLVSFGSGTKLLHAVAFLMPLLGSASAQELAPFTTDGCSHFPDKELLAR